MMTYGKSSSSFICFITNSFIKNFVIVRVFSLQGFNDTGNEFCSEKNDEDEDFVMAKCLKSINISTSDSRDKVKLLEK